MPRREGIMSMVRAGSQRGCWRRQTSEAGAALPLGRRKIVVERCPVAQKEVRSLLRPALDVAPVSLTAEGRVPLRTPCLRRWVVSGQLWWRG